GRQVAFLQPVRPPGPMVPVPDLLAFLNSGQVSICGRFPPVQTLRANLEGSPSLPSRSDTLSLDVQLNAPIPNVIGPIIPLEGTTWQIVLRTGSTPTIPLEGSLDGLFWFHDSIGQESNRATWLIRGAAPVMQQVVAAL